MKKYLYPLAALVVLIGGLSFLPDAKRVSAPPSTFILLDGSTRLMTELKGQVVLVNFWATSCASCIAEMPKLAAIHKKFQQRGYQTLAVAMSYDPPVQVVKFSQSRNLPFQVAIDNTGVIAKSWGDVKLTPTSYLVDKKGEVVKRYVGEPNFAELESLIEGLLSKS
jgi:peroxiredoxin